MVSKNKIEIEKADPTEFATKKKVNALWNRVLNKHMEAQGDEDDAYDEAIKEFDKIIKSLGGREYFIDWRGLGQEGYKAFIDAVKLCGGTAVDDPQFEESDTYGIIVIPKQKEKD